MKTITISHKYQVVIPKEIRGKLKLKPGQKLQVMQQAKVIDVTNSISILAARLSIKFKMPMADSIIYATDRIYDAIV